MLCHGKGIRTTNRQWYAASCDEKSDTRCDYCFYNMARRFPDRAIKMHQIRKNHDYEYDCDSHDDIEFSTFFLKNADNNDDTRQRYRIKISRGGIPLLPMDVINCDKVQVEIPNNTVFFKHMHHSQQHSQHHSQAQPISENQFTIQIIPTHYPSIKSYYTVEFELNGKKINILTKVSQNVPLRGATIFDDIPEFYFDMINKSLRITVIEYILNASFWMKMVNARHCATIDFVASLYDVNLFKSPFELYVEQIKNIVDEHEPGEEYVRV